MKFFIVAVPLFNSEMTVSAYKLKFQNSNRLFGTNNDYNALDGAMNSPGLDILNKVGLEPFTGGKPIFVPINKYLLLSKALFEIQLLPSDVIYILNEDIPIEAMYLEKCKELVRQGFSIALEGIGLNRDTETLFKLAEFVIMDSSQNEFLNKIRMTRIRYPHMKIIITNVSTKEYFNDIKHLQYTLFEGKFYGQPVTKGVTKVSPIKANALRLLKIAGEEDFELEEVTKIVQQDPSLSISLLKFINSPAIHLVGKINSISHAIALLGQRETAKWINAAVSLRLSDDKQNEITKLTLIRAKFAEGLAPAFGFKSDSSSLFLMGLFSLLDVILEMPMARAVDEISVNDRIKSALVNKEGPYAKVLELIYSYERADWHNVSYCCVMNNIDMGELNDIFIDTLKWYKELIENI